MIHLNVSINELKLIINALERYPVPLTSEPLLKKIQDYLAVVKVREVTRKSSDQLTRYIWKQQAELDQHQTLYQHQTLNFLGTWKTRNGLTAVVIGILTRIDEILHKPILEYWGYIGKFEESKPIETKIFMIWEKDGTTQCNFTHYDLMERISEKA